MNDVAQDAPGRSRSIGVIVALGTTQTVAWASSYYLPAILAAPIARDLGMTPTIIFGALSGALVISGLLGPRVGHFIDTFGGRGLLAVSNLVLAAGLLLLSFAHGPLLLAASWLLLGIGMGAGLYDAAFGALGRIYGDAARRSITGIVILLVMLIAFAGIGYYGVSLALDKLTNIELPRPAFDLPALPDLGIEWPSWLTGVVGGSGKVLVVTGVPDEGLNLRAAPALGSICVGVWLARRPLQQHAGRVLLLAVAGFGLCVIAFGLSRSLWLSAAILLAYGMCDGVSVVVRSTILQLATPDEMRGRVSSINGIFISSSNELGAFYAGTMARWLGLVPAVIVGGFAILGVVGATAWKAPALRRLDLKDLQ
jgi:MFS family permease